MAAPRCARSFLGSATRVKVSTPRLYAQTFSTSRPAQKSDEDIPGKNRGFREEMTLEERLAEVEISPEEFKRLWKSEQKAQKDFAKWEPKTAEEAAARWKQAKATPDHNSLLHMYKRAGVEPIKLAKERGITLPGGEKPALDAASEAALEALRTPINVQAVNMRPLRRAAEYGVPVCDLQLRTYSIRNLMLFADFAMRAAYYLGLAARGPVPLPRITERWTVPRANFVFKKSQENFERITMRRLIQIQDGHPDVVKAWLAFLQKHQYHGVGMKANIWQYETLEAATSVGVEIKEGEFTSRREGPMLDKVNEILAGKGYKEAMEGHKSKKDVDHRL